MMHYKSARYVIFCLLLLYSGFITWLMFFYWESGSRISLDIGTSYNLIPFKNIRTFIGGYMKYGMDKGWAFLGNLLGNFFLFTPLGLGIPYLTKRLRSLSRGCLLAFLCVFTLESMQWLSGRGIWDIDDILLNVSGWVLGTVTFVILSGAKKSPGS